MSEPPAPKATPKQAVPNSQSSVPNEDAQPPAPKAAPEQPATNSQSPQPNAASRQALRNMLPTQRVSATGRRPNLGKGLVPHTEEQRQKATRAIAELWKLSDRYTLSFEPTNIIILGQQSSGKTSWVERYLTYAFSVVATGMATTRPAVLTILPKKHGANQDVITVVEELEGGSKSEPQTMTDGPGGETALSKLFKWCTEKNQNKMPLKEKIFITIETGKCDTPRRVMDLPGVRAHDGQHDAGVNAAITEMLKTELRKPNSLVVCLAEASTDPLNDNLVRMLQESRSEWTSLRNRIYLVLTKSDQFFSNIGCGDDIRRQIQIWQQEFFGCEPMLVGYSFDHKEMKNDKGLDSRNNQYRLADAREEKAVKSITSSLQLDAKEACNWTFQTCKEIITTQALQKDLQSVPRYVEDLQARRKANERQLEELKKSSPRLLKEEATALVSAALGETIKFMISVPGTGREQFFSRPGALEDATKTLKEEELEFMNARWEYSIEAMLEASEAKDVRSIDYNRTDEHAPGYFDEFYETMLENENFMKSVPGFDLPLTAGAGARRSKEFFRLLALQYMHPDRRDRIRILNCTAMNPDMVHIEDDFVRIYEVIKAKAATMREITKYFTQKTVHLAMRCFNYAWENMLESKQVQRPIIDRLAGTFASGTDDEVDQVYQKIRAGFLQELLTHAHHCYVQSISDHQVRMLSLGAFGRAQKSLHPEGVNQERVAGAEKQFDAAREDLVKVNLPEGFEKQYPEAWAGVREGLLCVNKTGWADAVPSLAGRFIKGMLDTEVLAKENPANSDDQGLHDYDGISDRLERMNPDRQNRFFGKIAILFALMSPLFVMDVEARCLNGLLGSPNNQFYRHYFEKSMLEELTKTWNEKDLEARMEDEVQALERENKDLEEGLKALCEIRG